MDAALPVVAGMVSTTLFAASTLPMVVKAARTRDMDSYSRGNLVLSNVGNVVHTVYVGSLPFGPIWALHGFYLVTTAFMLAWYLRHARDRGHADDGDPTAAHDTHVQRATAPTPSRDGSAGRRSAARAPIAGDGRHVDRPSMGRVGSGPPSTARMARGFHPDHRAADVTRVAALRCVGRLVDFDHGEVRLDGVPPDAISEHDLRTKVGSL